MTVRVINGVSLRNRMRTSGFFDEIMYLFEGALDNFTSSIGLAYSDRRLLSSYTGPLMRVRVSGVGNTYNSNEYDVYPVATGGIDTSSLVVCTAGGSGGDVVGTQRQMSSILNTGAPAHLYYTRRFEQTGSGKYLQQNIAARQRKLTSTAGTLNRADVPLSGPIGKVCGIQAAGQGMDGYSIDAEYLTAANGIASTVFIYQGNDPQSNVSAVQLYWRMLNGDIGLDDRFRVSYGAQSLSWELGSVGASGSTYTISSVLSSIFQLTTVRNGSYAAVWSGNDGIIDFTNSMSTTGLRLGEGEVGDLVEGNSASYTNTVIGIVPETVIFKAALSMANTNTIASEQYEYWSTAA